MDKELKFILIWGVVFVSALIGIVAVAIHYDGIEGDRLRTVCRNEGLKSVNINGYKTYRVFCLDDKGRIILPESFQ